MIAWILAGLGIVASVMGALIDPRATAFAWMAAFAWGATLVLGALMLGLIVPVAPIRWSSGLPAVRALADNTALLAVLFVPIALAVPLLYGWAHPADLDSPLREVVLARGAWQTPTWFLVRSVVYLGVWIGVTRWCVPSPGFRPPGGGGPDPNSGGFNEHPGFVQAFSPRNGEKVPEGRMRGRAVLGLILVGVTWTLAAFDWWMSLEAGWTSSIYGMYVFAGGFAAALAAAVILSRLGEGRFTPALPADVYHALGRLLFAFVVVWAYLFWAQFLIVWIGGIPEEAHHLFVRLHGWPGSLVALLVTHFVLPFFLLLGRAPKRSPAFLAAVSALVLIAHAFDMAWLVLPALWPEDPLLVPRPPLHLVPVLLGPFLAVAGVLAIATRRRLWPVPEPLLQPTLSYRSP